jgi:hypothetical protein
MRTLLPTLALAACAAPPDDDAPPWAPPDGAPTAAYDPAVALTTFPDALHLAPDDTVPTGHRVALAESAERFLGGLLPDGFTIVEALEDLDGFGTTAAVTLSFTTAVDPGAFAAATRFVGLDDGADVPFTVEWTDEGRTALVEPWLPLAPESAYAVVVGADLVDAGGAPVFRSVPLDRAISGTLDGAPPILGALWARALDRLGLSPDDVAHGTVFPTQSLHAQDEAVVAALLEDGPTLTPGACVDEGDRRRCDATLSLGDVLGADGWIEAREAPAVSGRYDVPVSIWLPRAPGPYPVVVHGHGLGGDRGEARGDAAPLCGDGFAVVAIDAPRHGEHPLAEAGELNWILSFFGISIETLSMEVRVLRDDFRLAAWEKLALAATLDGFDADGDDVPDLEADTLGMSGHSLGAVMGVQPVAMDARFEAAFLSVPGGRVSQIVERGEIFGILVSVLRPPEATDGDVTRFFPVLQTAIERGDPLVWAPRLLDGSRDVLVQQVIDDDIMPNSTTRALARALGTPLVGSELQPVEGLARGPTVYPITGNVAGHTAALQQWDTLWTPEGPQPADHTAIMGNDDNEAIYRRWFTTWRDGGVAELIGQPDR